MVESPIFPIARFNTEVAATLAAKNAVLRRIYNELKAAGDDNLYYFEAKDIVGDNPEVTVDNYHFTDTGFDLFARSLAPLIRQFTE